ncbi:MAG: putative small integral rane protein [Cyanobacteria bacterium RYN_339]|nr:putative small integral rane protein [Cyanobacteria bacterium RYN_339]
MGRSIINEKFRRFAHWTSEVTGSPWAFITAVSVIVAWAITGPIFKFSDTWQLVINTGTTIVTFLMVFLIQNTQNRDAKAIHLKLDELIRGVEGARNNLVDLENLSDEELAMLQKQFVHMRETAQVSVTMLEEQIAELEAQSAPEVQDHLQHAKGDVEQARTDIEKLRKRRKGPHKG